MKGLGSSIRLLFIASMLMLAVDLVWIFFFTPVEATMGIVQKIFYIHVPSAYCMYAGFLTGFIASILYLAKRKEIYDVVACSAIEVGFVFATCVLITGPLWAKGAWGRFWDFDPRLTSTMIVWFIYLGYILIRRYFADAAKGKVFAAVIAVIGFIDAPIIHYSVKVWRGVHPSILRRTGGGGLPASMWGTLIYSGVSFTVLLAFIILVRVRRELHARESRGEI